ncbi:MAG: hypothetical protein DDT20_01768 [Firmicutes bacterium]|nr:hypothetical protein [Bacillota bacterium]
MIPCRKAHLEAHATPGKELRNISRWKHREGLIDVNNIA